MGLTLQSSGGTRATVEAARREIARFIERAAAERRVELPASKLVLGLNCGGSDSFSGITANPALGVCSDLLAALGGTAVLAETPEIFGAEHLLVRRARNRAVAEKLLGFIRAYKEYLDALRRELRRQSLARQQGRRADQHPRKVARRGGQGRHVHSDRRRRLRRARSPRPGFVFMNTPGYDPVSLTGLAAGGVQPDRLHHRPRQRHRLPHHPGDQDREQHRHLPPHARQHGRERGRHRGWRQHA